MNIDDLKAAVRNGRVRVTDHADEEAQSEGLTLEQVFLSLLKGEVVDDYGQDRPYPSWLVLGKTAQQKPVHSVWGCHPKNGWAILLRCTVPAEAGHPVETKIK